MVKKHPLKIIQNEKVFFLSKNRILFLCMTKRKCTTTNLKLIYLCTFYLNTNKNENDVIKLMMLMIVIKIG